MYNDTISLDTWLHHLRHLVPPVGVVLINAGFSSWINLLDEWEVTNAYFIESDERHHHRLQSLLLKNHAWQTHSALVWSESVEINFYQVSNPAENGIFPFETLAALWPNMQGHSCELRQTTTLSDLLSIIQPLSPPNWLVVDCLHSLTIIEGAGEWLTNCNVIVARVVLNDSMLIGLNVSKSALDNYLIEHDFRCVAIQEERNPALGKALYVRDWNLRNIRLGRANTKHEKLAAERQHELEQLRQERDTQTSAANETAQQVAQLGQATAKQEASAAERQHELEQLRQERDTQTSVANETAQQVAQLGQAMAKQEASAAERQHELEQLRQERDTQTSMANETAKQLDQMSQASAEQEKLAAKRHQQVQQLRQERDKQTNLANEIAKQLEQLGQVRVEQQGLAAERQHELRQLRQECDTQANLANETAKQLDQVSQARAEQEKLAAKRHQQIQQLRQERDAQTNLANETAKQLDQVSQARAEQKVVAAESQQQIEHLIQSKDSAEKLGTDLQKQINQFKLMMRQSKVEAEELAVEYQNHLEILRDVQRKTECSANETLATNDQKATQLSRPKATAATDVSQTQNPDHKITHASNSKTISEKRSVDLSLTTTYTVSNPRGNTNLEDLINDLSIFFAEKSITFVDVGSYIGEVFLEIYKSKKIKIREAHLYEPNPISYKALNENIDSCKIPTLHAYNFAIGKIPGSMHFNADHSMTKAITLSHGKGQISNTFISEIATLDNQVNSFTDRKINLLKIDVEGTELDVLTGATKLLTDQCVDVIYIEVGFNKNGTQQTYFGDVDDFLQKIGYRVFRIYEQVNEWAQDSPLLRRCNFAYMSKDFAKSNPLKIITKMRAMQEELNQLRA